MSNKAKALCALGSRGFLDTPLERVIIVITCKVFFASDILGGHPPLGWRLRQAGLQDSLAVQHPV
jgi:hypothetical protein